MLTYGDGGCLMLNIAELLAFHRQHGKLATLTTVSIESAEWVCLMLNGG